MYSCASRRGGATIVTAVLLTLTATPACSRAADVPGQTSPSTPSSADFPTTAPTATPASAPTQDAPPDVTGFAHQPLWPFADAAEVRGWQDAYRTGGHQPWHLDAGATALSFTQGYLGFPGVDRVTSTTTAGDDTWIGVGFTLPDGRGSTAAEMHLARWGSGPDAPWEVVGTRDATLVLDTPSYGSVARSPLTVGGTVTGVDESLRVRVLGLAGPVGESCCLPAGGEASRWSTTVPFTGAANGTLTVVVSTGGHVADVERFAITGISAGSR